MRGAGAILADRLRVVLALGDANAAHHRAQAALGGAEIDLMTDPLAQARVAAAQAALDAAAARVATLDAELAALDAELATAP